MYAVGHRALTREGTWLAAALACGDGAVISHLDAAVLWGLLRSQRRGPVHVTVPTRTGRARREGIRVHRVPLTAGDVTRRRGVAVTTVARTLVDVATLLDGRPLERALDEAHYLDLLDSRVLAATLDRNAGRAGARRLGTVLAGHEPGSTRTRSELKERFLALCSAHRSAGGRARESMPARLRSGRRALRAPSASGRAHEPGAAAVASGTCEP